MAQDEEVTFELLVYTGSHWEAQGTYGAREQMIAIADAKSLAKVSTVKGVKVVKEFFDGRSNVSRSLTVFEHTPNAPSSKPRALHSGRRTGASGQPFSDDPSGDDEKDKPKRPTFLGTTVKILLSIVFSIATALVVTQMATIALKGVRTIGVIDKEHFLVLVFILVFAITALALVTRILMTLKRIAPLLPSVPSIPKAKKRKRDMRLTPSVEEKNKPAQKEGREKETDPRTEEAEQTPLKEALKKAEEEERKNAEEEARKRAEEDRKRAETAAEADALSEIITMRAFADDALDVLDGDKDKQDAHTVFGLVLFMVGALHALRTTKNLSERIAQTVSLKALGHVGLNRERALYFMEHTDQYLMSNPRYSQMFQAGRSAMTVYLTDDTGPRGTFSEALEEWAKPNSQADKAGLPVTVLFTDIAGSTAMTQKLGDAGAQDVVRLHNKIVRSALQSFTGREIKHTGDGIMASFPTAAAGVEAAIDMQKQTKAHNASDPAHPLGLKIGLNTGDPISEDDDLFGTTVQLAARIVDKAASGQILVSGSVQGLSQGKTLKFSRFADLDMKGFDEAVTVFEVQWDLDAKTALESEPKPEPTSESKSVEEPETKPEPQAAPAAQAQPEPAAQAKPQVETQPAKAPPVSGEQAAPAEKPTVTPPPAAAPQNSTSKPEATATSAAETVKQTAQTAPASHQGVADKKAVEAEAATKEPPKEPPKAPPKASSKVSKESAQKD